MTASNRLGWLSGWRSWSGGSGTTVIIAACLLTGTVAGCVHITPGVSGSVPTVRRAFDWTVALYVPAESAEYEIAQGVNLFRIGPTFKSAALETLKRLFADAYDSSAPRPAAGQPVPDLVIVQTIDSFTDEYDIPLFTFPVYRAELKATWEVRDAEENPLFSISHAVSESAEANLEVYPQAFQRTVEVVMSKLLSQLAADLGNEKSGRLSQLMAARARTVGFLGWVCSSDLESLAVILSEHLSGAMEKLGCQSVSEDAVRGALAAQGVSLNGIIADKSRVIAIARALRCGVVVAGQIEAVGENLRLSLLQFDGRTGKRMAEAEEVVQPDDLKGLIDAVERMMSSLQLGERAP